jgi:hypothetical protein
VFTATARVFHHNKGWFRLITYRTDSSPYFLAAGSCATASSWSSSAIRKDFNLPEATADSITEDMTLGSMVSGIVRRLKRVRAGNTRSTESGLSLRSTNSVKVAQDTRNGVYCGGSAAIQCGIEHESHSNRSHVFVPRHLYAPSATTVVPWSSI